MIIAMEVEDNNKLNKVFEEKVRGKNPDCLDYLQLLADKPVWRMAFFNSFLTTVALYATMKLTNVDISVKKQSLILLVVFFANLIINYKIETSMLWHAICSDGCSQDGFPISSRQNVHLCIYLGFIMCITTMMIAGVMFVRGQPRKI